MEPSAAYDGDHLTVQWKTLPNTNNYTVFVDQCDWEFQTCSNRLQVSQQSAGLTTDTVNCWPHINVRLEAWNGARLMRAETLPLNSDCEAMDTVTIILIIVLSLICLVCLALCGIIAYHKRNPLQRIQRVRSKMYSRIYSKDRYERPIAKTEFLGKMDDLLLEEEGNELVVPGLREEFSELERVSCDTIHRRTSAASEPVNRKRNRYHDIAPYDYNRVKLVPPVKLEDDQEHSDFLNASHIPALLSSSSSSSSTAIATLKQQSYIAAQGPSDETIPLFWEMVWQRDVRVIVMLTNVVEGFGFNAVKCSQYWPSQVGQSLRVSPDLGQSGKSSNKRHHLQVQLFDVQESPDYTVRRLDVSDRDNGESREVVHLQFTAWPDRAAPVDPGTLLQLLSVTEALSERYMVSSAAERAPWLVHCSAGVGRTGTFIAVNQLLQQLDDRNRSYLDVFNHVYNLRKCRSYMVQSGAQYVYIYKCLREHLRRKERDEESQS